jgi:hypothetical protein
VLGIKLRYPPSLGKTDSPQEYHAKALGIEVDDLTNIEFLRQHPAEFTKWKRRIESRNIDSDMGGKPLFPTRTSVNPERRETRLAEQIADAPEKEYDVRNRSVRITRSEIDPATWLRSQYTNDDQQLICQICREEMPFRKRNGEYYFEAIEAFSRDFLGQEHEGQFLALCPLCAAMYTELVKRNESAMEIFMEALMNAEEPEIPIHLGALETSIRFVDTHFSDIKTIIRTPKATFTQE